MLIRSGEALGVGWSRNMLYSGFNILHRSVVRWQTGLAARITRTLSGFEKFKLMEWNTHLKNLSLHLLGNLDQRELEHLRQYHEISDYLGYPPAVIEEIELAQNRLGFELPKSLTSFYLASNGFHSADGFPVAIGNILPISKIFLLSDCRSRELEIFETYVQQNFEDGAFPKLDCTLKNCVVIIDFDGNELGFSIRSVKLDDWPVVTYNPDGDDFESYPGFIDLMKDGLRY